jgi:ribosomal protein L20A (L18A)
VRRLQAPELQHDEEQEEDDRAAGVQQVLPLLSQTHGAQRDEIEVEKVEEVEEVEKVTVASRGVRAVTSSTCSTFPLLPLEYTGE